MKKVLKWISIILGVLILVIVVAITGLYMSVQLRADRAYTIQPANLAIPNDASAIARGKRWSAIHCQSCHGDDLAGTAFFSDPGLGSFNASNLTKGKGGVGAAYTDTDWVRAIRHGVRPNGKPVLVMPSADFYYLSDGDLSDIIAYVKSIPAVDKEWAKPNFTFIATVLAGAGAFGDLYGAETINHTAPRPIAPKPGATVEYGDYLVRVDGCRTCHGKELAGGKEPNPEAPPGPNLTPGGEIAKWSEADFINAMRTGARPSGIPMTQFMPWQSYGKMSDDELKAIWLYLKSLPAKATVKP
ncbi:MAG: c-type cytochrome [Chloroflexi bacterium]|nr:c-type cytochrome [Chloroflexota bacterium]